MKIPIRNIAGKINAKDGLHWVDHILLKTVGFLYLAYDLVYFHFAPYFIFFILANYKNLREVEITA